MSPPETLILNTVKLQNFSALLAALREYQAA
jgi:hypothetical protein